VKPSKRWTRAAAALGVAMAATAMTTASAGARPAGPAGTAAPAAAAPSPTTLVFDKNPADPMDSRLSIYKNGRVQKSYRAGSGIGVKDDCVRNKGWMPNGDWRIRLKSRTYNGRSIKGYAVYLQNMSCAKRTTTRTEMFIHSEMNRDGSQGRTEPRRWDGVGDYKSNGCVKLRPEDIKDLFTRLDRLGWPTHLRVIS
jgi:lipoprotein-anchoring transpeptidase ErfK/SrfK